MKKLFYALAIVTLLISACKKEDTKKPGQLDSNQLSSVTSSASTMSIQLQTFMQSALTQAMLSGKSIGDYPDIPASSKSGASALLKGVSFKSGGNWIGPDADGWYSMSYTGLYTYTYKIRYKDSTLTCITSFNYSGGDGSYSNTTTTEFTKYTKNKKVLWKGFTDIQIKAFGDNDISNVEWKFIFSDWDSTTGAGTYDWYWSANSLGGDLIPYHRYLNIVAMDKGGNPEVLHVIIIWYDDGGVQVGSFEYDTTWTPVDMSAMP